MFGKFVRRLFPWNSNCLASCRFGVENSMFRECVASHSPACSNIGIILIFYLCIRHIEREPEQSMYMLIVFVCRLFLSFWTFFFIVAVFGQSVESCCNMSKYVQNRRNSLKLTNIGRGRGHGHTNSSRSTWLSDSQHYSFFSPVQKYSNIQLQPKLSATSMHRL